MENQKGADSEKAKDIRSTNITAARAVADVVRTSLGPRGMDKMVSFSHILKIYRYKIQRVKYSSPMMAPQFLNRWR